MGGTWSRDESLRLYAISMLTIQTQPMAEQNSEKKELVEFLRSLKLLVAQLSSYNLDKHVSILNRRCNLFTNLSHHTRLFLFISWNPHQVSEPMHAYDQVVICFQTHSRSTGARVYFINLRNRMEVDFPLQEHFFNNRYIGKTFSCENLLLASMMGFSRRVNPSLSFGLDFEQNVVIEQHTKFN